MRIFSSLWSGTSVSPATKVARGKEQGCEAFNGEGGGSLTRKAHLMQQPQQESIKSGAVAHAHSPRLSATGMPPLVMGDAVGTSAKATAPTAPLQIGAKNILAAKRRAAAQPAVQPLFPTGAESIVASSSSSDSISEAMVIASVRERVAALLRPTSTIAREVRVPAGRQWLHAEAR